MVQARPDAQMQDVDMDNDHEQGDVKVAQPLELLMINQEQFYLWSNQNNQEIRTLSETIFLKNMNNFIKSL